MRVLVVDDDVELVGLVRYALAGAGYEVVTAYDGDQAMQKFTSLSPDLVILDVNLPGRSGFELLAEIRRGSDVPVMMLTVRSAEEDEVRGLDLGADDYMRKPFSPRAMLARVRALLRRGGDGDVSVPAGGPVVLDMERSAASVMGGPAFRLSVLELRLLRLLMAQGGKPVDPHRLIGFVWTDRDAPDREALKQLVHRLRHKLAKAGGSGAWIVHVPNAGYSFEISAT